MFAGLLLTRHFFLTYTFVGSLSVLISSEFYLDCDTGSKEMLKILHLFPQIVSLAFRGVTK